ncbi:MAG TPA: hypothetical protein VHX14_07230, partial [Thermoanaerobaculia bacterium]|nr:hypothetical protein [Thermoanaerobaculia bacterium]
MSTPAGSQSAGSQTSAGTKIAAWVFDKFVGGAFGAGAGFGMDQVLSLIGLKETSTELARRLTNIQAGIDQILQEVTAIRLQLDALFEALGIVKADILRAIDESAIADSRSVIDTHYGTGSSSLMGAAGEQATSLSLAVSRR